MKMTEEKKTKRVMRSPRQKRIQETRLPSSQDEGGGAHSPKNKKTMKRRQRRRLRFSSFALYFAFYEMPHLNDHDFYYRKGRGGGFLVLSSSFSSVWLEARDHLGRDRILKEAFDLLSYGESRPYSSCDEDAGEKQDMTAELRKKTRRFLSPMKLSDQEEKNSRALLTHGDEKESKKKKRKKSALPSCSLLLLRVANHLECHGQPPHQFHPKTTTMKKKMTRKRRNRRMTTMKRTRRMPSWDADGLYIHVGVQYECMQEKRAF